MKIGIVGGGLMGLAVAYRLSSMGHAVSVYERASQIGGLATWHDFGRFVWDRFYHVILPSDSHLIGFLKDIGLENRLCWATTQTGFYVDRQFYPLNSSLDFLKFPPLSLWSKLRLGMTILYCSRINDWRRLESVNVEDWLTRTSGKVTYEKLWKPLLLAKLGENYRRVSAVFIWTYVKRMFSARDTSAQKEQLGHVCGGYKVVFERLRKLIHQNGGVIKTGVTVKRIDSVPDRGLCIAEEGRSERFDKVIFTGPVNVMRKVVSQELIEVQAEGADVEYLGVICVVLVTSRSLMPYYILNIADDRVPFTGAIGMSNIVSTDETDGLHITYLPKYVLSSDPILRRPDSELQDLFLEGVSILFPEFDIKHDIVSLHVNRERIVQPLQVMNYSKLVPKAASLHPEFFILNTAQFVNNTLNNNELIRNVTQFFSTFGEEFIGSRECEGVGPTRRS